MSTILVKRKGALGDVLLTTPIVKRLHNEGNTIDVRTDHPEVFLGNPYVWHAFSWGKDIRGIIANAIKYERVIDLDLCYEKKPKMHIIDAYSLEAFGDTKTPHELQLFVTVGDKDLSLGLKRHEYIVLHMGVSWENRTWDYDNWIDLAGLLLTNFNKKLVVVGARNDRRPPVNTNIIDTVGQFDLHEVSFWIANACLFIGTDSSLLHIAQACGTPSVGLYTCAKAEYRSTGALAVVPKEFTGETLSCYGCLHEVSPPVTYVGCKRGDFFCVKEGISPEMVIDRVKEILK